ncbi:MAG: ribonuclease P protein component [Bacteroidales bacterium]|jgi:ribonuclease P protein component|nr:ribonuclease P protein component [Bacteroidales bacterium]HOL98794.1 ribonuclease P protein component [Bacteroidales bacterium]HOM37044.1 ribonuclease P protein component [Bacteroidales bacterium]HPD24669.1 ribonuclease P protein component [Bacteroidales bacterium]HRT00414.1 ribonuclease P protein component [Bacteroidales bacterium]
MSLVHPYSLNRKNSLKLKSDIDRVLKSKNKIRTDILTVFYIFDNYSDTELKILITVPKRIIKKAYQRNIIKRRIKEALRLNSKDIRDQNLQNALCLKIAIVFHSQNLSSFDEIQEKIVLSLQKIYKNRFGHVE